MKKHETTIQFLVWRKILLLGFFFSLLNGCVEPFEVETEVFESALVIEGTITDELEHQEILLTRTYRLEENRPTEESNADVRVLDDMQNVYWFEEYAPGNYRSVSPFRAEPQRIYQLEITTDDGREYGSQPSALVAAGNIEELYAAPVVTSRDEEGIGLLLSASGSSTETGYYRYEYTETYKFQSPYLKTRDLVVVDDRVVVVDKVKEEFTCFRTAESQRIILANTDLLTENSVNDLLIRFIPDGDPTMSHRYSILVKQYSLSREAYNFYKTLKEISESESLFSQTQPGFLNGNVFSKSNPDEKVLGFFSVSGVTSKRTFFSYTDFFEDDGPRPSFFTYCPVQTPETYSELVQLVKEGSVRLFEETPCPESADCIHKVVRAACVDCTLSGSNVVPEFWEE